MVWAEQSGNGANAIFENHHNNKYLPLTKNVCRRVTTLSLVKQQ
jgi:hypothetical protein